MKTEDRAVVCDRELGMEAYRLQGVIRPFPNHFHDYYVLGVVEAGTRRLTCRGRVYDLGEGAVLLFNPGDSHACARRGGGTLDYRGLNLTKEVMGRLAGEITGGDGLPGFGPNVIADPEAARCLRSLHESVMTGTRGFGREEQMLFLLSRLIRSYGRPFSHRVPKCGAEVERACAFMEEHFAEHICLDQVCRCAGLSKSTLLRAFVKAKGITPYGYLENIRIREAGRLLAQGVAPAETALRTGFSDQSHLTNRFSRFTGLTPGACRKTALVPNLSEKRDTDGSAE